MTRIILVRHCESEANRAGPDGGASNSPLTAGGQAQAAAVGRGFAADVARSDLSFRAAALISSHLARAADTAAAIEAAIGVSATHDPRLGAGEAWVGQFDLDDPATLLVVGAQVLAALSEVSQGGADPVIVVSHRYPIWSLLTVLYGDGGTAIMDRLNNLGNGDRLEFELLGDVSPAEPVHRPLISR